MKFNLSKVCIAVIASQLITTQAMAEEADAQQDVKPIETMVVTASRIERPLSQIPNTITVIDKTELDQQLSINNDLSTLLGNLVPSFSPSRQKMTSAGESLRGRKPLYLIDGVPQSNPLRSGGRDGHTIDPFLIERVEVLHGANAIHGLGAAGGIINLITKKPTQGLEQQIKIDGGFQTQDVQESADWGLSYSLANNWDNTDLLAALTYRSSGMAYDANGQLIGVDNTQGDTMDSKALDAFIKAGYNWDTQRLELMVNRYQIEGNNNWISVSGDVAADIPSSAIEGSADGEAAQNAVTTVSLGYSNQDFLDHKLSVQLFHQDFEATYGAEATPIATFQDPAYGADLIDQSQNNSEKTGIKITLIKSDLFALPVDLVYGLDILKDETWQALIQTGRSWVPPTEYTNYAPYAQLEFAPDAPYTLTAGVRHEIAKLQVDDFTTLASYGSQFVQGGNPDFSQTLYNLGATYKVTDSWRVFANYSEAFSMPDVGRVLRGINVPGQSVETFLDLKPILTENTELGIEYAGSNLQAQLAYYMSDSDFGQRLQRGVDGIYTVKREMTEVDGIEFRVNWTASSDDLLGLRLALSEGRYDSDQNGKVDTDLGGSNIAPDRINASWDRHWGDNFSTRLQVNHLLDRDFENKDGDVTNEFNGYTTVDFSGNLEIGDGKITLGVQNLTNTDYYTYYSQTSPNDIRNFKGLGRSFTLSYQLNF
ncbi:TonB-dependent receptor [Shewanella sp. AS1]|uniref:TonB-dependent receptor n=1 Tax=Shewanella sp. AS1 TaxID=2907626 RepID=UPI001F392080|nr:TonB-dependent receptor [Shewanella sp. AS1]MCE9680237.1 TonB-dependent receptor [Shewanella sp. AS1]